MKRFLKIENEVNGAVYLDYYRSRYENLKLLELAIGYLRSEGGIGELGKEESENQAKRQEVEAEKVRGQLKFIREKLCQ